MSEHAPTHLSLTPVKGTWQDVFSRIELFVRERYDPDYRLPDRGSLLVVDPSRHRIDRRIQVDVRMPTGPEPKGLEYWRGLTAEVVLDATQVMIVFAVREVTAQQTDVEVLFPTRVYESIFNFGNNREFNPSVKSALIRVLIGMTRGLGAAGFGYRRGKEDSLFGPLSVERLRDYIEVGSRYFARRHELELLAAGLDVSCVKETDFEYHDDDRPIYYRQDGFYVFDILWP